MPSPFGFRHRRCCLRKPWYRLRAKYGAPSRSGLFVLKECALNICRFVFPAVVPLLLASSGLAQDPISHFQHVIVIVQENRTPDNLFQGLCLPPYGNRKACGSGVGQFDIQGYGYDRSGNKAPLAPVPLGNPYDPPHNHGTFETMCNPNRVTFYPCSRNTKLPTAGCPAKCSFELVDPTGTPTIYPYLYMAQNFGWANRMFQTNQGPSAPAHQFLFAGTSAPSAADDAAAVFVAENALLGLGCLEP